MKIIDSDVHLQSSHYKEHEIYEKEHLEMWDRPEDAPQRLQQTDRLELTYEFKRLHHDKSLEELNNELTDATLDPKLMEIIRALEVLTGKKINITKFQNLHANELKTELRQEVSDDTPQRVGWGIDYQYERREVHKESLEFSASGNVTTEDGKSLDFSVALSMKSQLQIYESLSIKAGDALIDPLVLNFNNSSVQISNVKHSFDLDLDSKSDTFSFVGSGSGFLALDKNKDGLINDGSELFGPTLGNGFEELQAYDTDNNGWIDENDSVFDELIIWTKDENGNENLYRLRDKGIGSLYLNPVETEFSFTNGSGDLQAKMRESSIFLDEDGEAGTLQEIDLVV